MEIRIPIYQPSLNGNEKKYVNECLDSTWISSKGKFISLFENGFAEYVNVKHATAVTNGTVAIHLALLALGIGPGDEVIVPTLTYIASVNAITYTGAVPVFVDSLADSWQVDPKDIEKKITTKTKAVMAVHLYGQSCKMDVIQQLCRANKIFLIEDCAEAIGTKYNGIHVGTFGDIATFSFFGNKTITTGEGGMVVTNDKTFFDRVCHFKGQGLAKHREYWHDVVGYNYRMTNICAAIGYAQLENIQQVIDRKRQIATLYEDAFRDSDISFHKEQAGSLHSYWMCSILVSNAEDRDPLRNLLANHGIETRPLFYPAHTMPMYSKQFNKFPVAEDLGWRGINLPSYPALTDSQVREVAALIVSYK